jgi:hypothetical protein
MAKRDEVFGSGKYLKASDLKGLPGKAITVTISDALLETIKDRDGEEKTKTVLSFKGAQKRLPLNQTNWDAIAEITGEDDTDNWQGHAVQLYATVTDLKGSRVDCLRIRHPDQKELSTRRPIKSAPSDDIDDSIPF